MKFLYKTVMFLTLLIFCIGSVCATDPDNTTGGLNPVNPPINNTTEIVKNTTDFLKMLNSELEKRDTIIQNHESKINELNNTVNNQSVIINSLKDDNKILTDRVQALEYSKLTQSNRIKSLEIDIKNLEDSNKQLIDSNKALNAKIDNQNSIINELNNTVNNQNSIINNQSVIINELNIKLDLQLIEIKGLQADKDKLNAEIKQIYEKLLSSPKKEDFDQLKKEIDNKNKQIDKLNAEINTLRAIISVSRNDVCNSLKGLSSTENIKCGKYTFRLDDYLKIPLIKDGKDRVIKYKKSHKRLPNYVTIAGYEVPKNVYKKLYNL